MTTARPKPKATLMIPIAAIIVGEQKIRADPEDDSIGELAESIAAKGLLQPIGVTESADGTYQLRWGHRRLLAHQRLNRTEILASLYEGDEKSIKGLALIENLHRSQMTLEDEVKTVEYLATEEEKTTEQISQIVNKSRQWVLDRLAIPNLPEWMREPLLEGSLPMSHIEVIYKVPDESAQRYLVSQCILQKWSKAALRIIADCYMTPLQEGEAGNTGIKGVSPNNPLAPFLYECQMCKGKAEINQVTLIRIHADGYGCRTIPDRPDNESTEINGLERDSDQDERPGD